MFITENKINIYIPLKLNKFARYWQGQAATKQIYIPLKLNKFTTYSEMEKPTGIIYIPLKLNKFEHRLRRNHYYIKKFTFLLS